MRVLIILILLTGCVKDYDLNPYTTVMRFIVNEKKTYVAVQELKGGELSFYNITESIIKQ